MAVEHDLDALAVEPLAVKVNGKSYPVAITVATMIKLDKARQDGSEDQWELVALTMEAAGMPREEFLALNAQQALKLSELVTAHFFPEAAETLRVAEAAMKLTGPMPSPDSSATSEEAIP
ncbi:MAG TPA: hypothetical protein VNA25_30480 [Phycisphaerae bacterium]|nr:hypothetical protein [Phycisphaerae bacterium]